MKLHFLKSMNMAAVMRVFFLCVLVSGLAGTVCSPAQAAVYYVKQGATGLNDGTSWGNAFTGLQSAISAVSGGDEIWVAAGTYSPGSSAADSFSLIQNIGIYGGFNGTETLLSERNWTANVTILDGAHDNEHVIRCDTVTSSAVLDGFTITGGAGGTSSQGGGLYNNGGSPTVRNCTFTANIADKGAGIYNNGGSPIIENCVFSGNTANNGGGIFNYSSSPIIRDCTFSGNFAEAPGGGIFSQNSTAYIKGCTFSGNVSNSSGGGIYNENSTAAFVSNCTFSGNAAASDGGGIFNATGGMNITNSTFIGNSGTNGGGISNMGMLTISNTIAADSTASYDLYNLSPGTVTSDFNILENTNISPSGANDITGDQPSLNIAPLADNGGPTQTHALLSGSIAIDAGDPAFTAPPDYDQRGTGFPRVNNCRIDIGAYESSFDPEIQVLDDTGIDIVSSTGIADYETTPLNTPVSMIFTVKNLGTDDLVLSNMTVTPGLTIVSGFASPSTVTVPSGNSATFKIRMDAVSIGPFSGAVQFDTTDCDENPFSFTVQGTVITPGLPEMDILLGTEPVVCGSSHDFGDVTSNASSSPAVFTISNTGNADLNLTGTSSKISISGTNALEFVIDETTLISPIPGSGNSTFSVIFAPAGEGIKTASISIANNDADENPYVVNLTGTGTAVNVPPVILQLNEDTVTYTGLPIGLDQGNDAAVTDANNSNFIYGYLSAEIILGSDVNDVLEISNDADGDGNTETGIFADANNFVFYNNVSIGYIGTGFGNTVLKVFFETANADAVTPAMVGDLIRAVRYSSTVAQTGTASKSVSFTLCDGGKDSLPAIVTVSFGQRYRLSVSISGSGSVSGSGIACPSDCYEDFPAGEIVSLTAYPYSGYILSGWNGVMGSSGNSASVKMDSDKVVTVIFVPDSHYPPDPYPYDLCPYDPNKTEPGICGCGVADTDTDGDGTADCKDQCLNDPAKTEPGICGCGVADTDTDGDGTADCKDQCLNDPAKTEPGICGCGVADTDTDGDGTADCKDQCLNDPAKTEPGICGCGVADTDTDGDGTADCKDQCPTDANKTEPGICGCGVSDADKDGDGTADCKDQCLNDPAKTEPGICGCGVADTDTDGDGTADCKDNCPNDAAKTEPGICGCGVADTDTDGDGTADCKDQCPTDANKTEQGICGCGVADTDTDGDGTADCKDQCPDDPDKTEPGVCGCGISDADKNGDGLPDCINNKEPDPPKPLNPKNKIYPPGPITLKTAPYSDPEGDIHLETLWVIYRTDNSCGETVEEHASATDLTEYTVTGLQSGLRYGWKAGFRDSGSSRVSWSEEQTLIVGENVTDETMRSQPGTEISDYRMFSFPYLPENPSSETILNHIIGGNYDTRYFRIGTYDPQTGEYIEYGPDLEFEPGRAYWFLTRNGADILQTGAPVATEEDVNVKLGFDPSAGRGWNMVAAPNSADYLWQDVEIVISSGCINIAIADLPEDNPYISKKLWQWDADGYSADADRLEKGKGYWVKVKQQGIWLKFRADKQMMLSDAEISGSDMSASIGKRIWRKMAPDSAHADEEDSPPMPPGGFAENGNSADSGGSGGCFIRTAREN